MDDNCPLTCEQGLVVAVLLIGLENFSMGKANVVFYSLAAVTT